MPAWAAVHACLVVLLVLATSCHGAAELPAGLISDRKALIALQQAVSANGYGLSRMATWKISGNPCFPKAWPHVLCGGGRVVAVNLSNLKVQGTLPPELKLLNALVTLNLDGNKFTGTIPDEWADNAYFLALKTLTLQNNLLRGKLPNRRWNRLNGFVNLRTLDLSGNAFYGGLPDGWLSTAKMFKRLESLDLSGNYLGFQDAGKVPFATTYATSGSNFWCLAGELVGTTQATGWCPRIPATGAVVAALPGTLAALRFLDLSDNGFQGFLPPQWGSMFPKLQYLLINDNDMTAAASGVPAALPSSWTRRTAPRVFPSLQALVLYPGNADICCLPDATQRTLPDGTTFYGNGESYQDVNPDSSYQVLDSGDEAYDSQNPWLCAGPDAEHAPSNIVIDEVAHKIQVTFDGEDNSATQTLVYGYKFTIYLQEEDPQVWDPISDWNGRFYQVYGLSGAVPRTYSTELVESPAGSYTLSTGYGFPDVAGTYKVEVTAVYLDGYESELGSEQSVGSSTKAMTFA